MKSNVKILHSEKNDAKIIDFFKGKKHDIPFATLQQQTGLSCGSIYRRARHLNAYTKRHGYSHWSSKELEILADYSHWPLAELQKKLKRVCGVLRTERGIAMQRMHQGITIKQSRLDVGIYSMAEVARMMSVCRKKIKCMINRSELAAVIDPITGEYQIKESDIKAMLKNHTSRIDFSKIDKYWLVDVLTSQTGAKKHD